MNDMATTRNGNPGNHPTRRLRFDASTSRLVKSPPAELSPTHSGRRLVTVAVCSILILWGSLYLAFREWRARFHERVAYGKKHVAPAVDPLGHIVPPDVDPIKWRRAVRETHDMIVTLTGSNVLTLDGMKDLENELTMRIARAQPETARAELAAIWDDLRHRAGPIVTRHPRPEILEKGASRSRPQTTPAEKN